MFRGPYFILSTMQAGTTPIFNVFGMTGPSSNRESNPQILLVSAGPPYHRLLRSAGATEDLFVTRELHQEPPPRIPTGCALGKGTALSQINFSTAKIFSTRIVRLYIAGLPLRSCRTNGAPSVQGSAQSLYFCLW